MTEPFFKTDCPSCGAPVEAHSATAVTLVCGHCHSMLVRHDEGIRDTGRDSALLEDFSPLQTGTVGRFAGTGFTLAGRLQVKYDAGAWNEWYALFDDGGTGWLSEAGDLYVMTRSGEPPSETPAFHDIRAGYSTLDYQGKRFTASDVREITLSQAQAEGELPFALSDGLSNRVADWRCENLFVTLDYADPAAPELFYGRMVKLDELGLQNTRSDDRIRETAGRLKGERVSENCPSCGSPVHWVGGLTHVLTCPACASELDVSEAKADLIRANDMRSGQAELFTLPIGKTGRLNGIEYTVIGAVRYAETDAQETFDAMYGGKAHNLPPEGSWNEYLLYNTQKGFRWLVEAEDGWSMSETLETWPRLDRNGQPQGLSKLYDYGGVVAVAAGAFYWRVKSGDLNYYTDYKQGSGKLCAEISANEMAWSKSMPVSAAHIAAAFGLDETGMPHYAAQAGGGTVPKSKRVLMLVVLIVLNLPALFMEGGSDGLIFTAMAGWLMWSMGGNADDEED
ncbi:DUF4178 domain-containing protein [Neisseria sp.]|uniref:DUF4178 domain-containing protein n=1 Tax=Neisseria sp. TaxID=192066 RepID=UPI00359F579B